MRLPAIEASPERLRARRVPRLHRTARQTGVTLLEVLIAVLIISFGLLGMAGLQSVGMQRNLGSAQRTAVTLLQNDIADRMRANMAAVAATANFYANTYGGGTRQPTCLQRVGCSAQLLAQHDVWEWNQALKILPQGQGVVCHDVAPIDDGDSYLSATSAGCNGGPSDPWVIKIWWLEDRSDANPTLRLKRVVIGLRL